VTANSLLWQLGVVLNHYPYQSQWDSPLKVLWEMSQIALSNEWITLAKRFPDDVMVRYSYGRWLLSVPKYDMAINVFREVIESNQLPLSLRGSGFKYLGMAMMNSGHTNEAEDALNAALEQSPPDLQANCLLGELYQKNGHLTQAKRALLACH
jgi:tetratricopeptide (TPR) repeat protein